ncbi:hypothetical protein ACFVW2_33720 [Streptomyces sp. NPDC058171]
MSDLLRETLAVQRMVNGLRISDAAGAYTSEAKRGYLIRRVALDERHLAVVDRTSCDLAEAAAHCQSDGGQAAEA